MTYRVISGERVYDLTPATDPDWHLDIQNAAELYRWLEFRGREPDDPPYFMERLRKWTPEWQEMWAARAEGEEE